MASKVLGKLLYLRKEVLPEGQRPLLLDYSHTFHIPTQPPQMYSALDQSTRLQTTGRVQVVCQKSYQFYPTRSKPMSSSNDISNVSIQYIP